MPASLLTGTQDVKTESRLATLSNSLHQHFRNLTANAFKRAGAKRHWHCMANAALLHFHHLQQQSVSMKTFSLASRLFLLFAFPERGRPARRAARMAALLLLAA